MRQAHRPRPLSAPGLLAAAELAGYVVVLLAIIAIVLALLAFAGGPS